MDINELLHIITMKFNILSQERDLLVEVIKHKCRQLYVVRCKLCKGRTIGNLKTVLIRSPNGKLGSTYRLQYFEHEAPGGRGLTGATRWKKGANNLPDARYLNRFTRDQEREVVMRVLKDLALLDEYLASIQKVLWQLHQVRAAVLDAITTTPFERAVELGRMATADTSQEK